MTSDHCITVYDMSFLEIAFWPIYLFWMTKHVWVFKWSSNSTVGESQRQNLLLIA